MRSRRVNIEAFAAKRDRPAAVWAMSLWGGDSLYNPRLSIKPVLITRAHFGLAEAGSFANH